MDTTHERKIPLSDSYIPVITSKISGLYRRYDLEGPKEQKVLFDVADVQPKIFISIGNEKLGLLPNFNLPARSFLLNGELVVTCPGATTYCRKVCYAQKGQYIVNRAIPLEYAANYLASLRPDFVDGMIDAISIAEERNARMWLTAYGRLPEHRLFRLHTSGDFYSPEYAEKWYGIASNMPDINFYAYTKAWIHFHDDGDVADIGMTAEEVNALNEEIMKTLIDINKLPNFQILLSTDKTTGPIPPELLDMGFKEAGIDFAYAKYQGRPYARCLYQTTEAVHLKEEGKTLNQLIREEKIFTCDRCGFCWDKNRYPKLNVYFEVH